MDHRTSLEAILQKIREDYARRSSENDAAERSSRAEAPPKAPPSRSHLEGCD